MPDIPPEVQVALETLKALTAAGRCREDAPLYALSVRGVSAYLEAAFPETDGAPPAVPAPARR